MKCVSVCWLHELNQVSVYVQLWTCHRLETPNNLKERKQTRYRRTMQVSESVTEKLIIDQLKNGNRKLTKKHQNFFLWKTFHWVRKLKNWSHQLKQPQRHWAETVDLAGNRATPEPIVCATPYKLTTTNTELEQFGQSSKEFHETPHPTQAAGSTDQHL